MTINTDRWGPWRLHDHEMLGPILEREWDNPARHYWVELRTCTSSAQVLDIVIHTARHSWADDATLGGLVHALDDVLNPISNLCGSGKSRTLRPKRLHEILAHAVAR